MTYLLDTNIIIYYFNGLAQDNFVDELLKKHFNISVITKIEFLSWSKFAQNAQLYKKAEKFMSYANVIDLSEDIVQETILLRQQHKTKTPDAIIAATALIHQLQIATNNQSDFESLGVNTISIQVK